MTKITSNVLKILENYSSENYGVQLNLTRMMMHGHLSGTGKLMILPVDQGFEHGPSKSFLSNPPSFDPAYHIELASKCGFSAYAAPLGALEVGLSSSFSNIPTILKVNHSVSISNQNDQAITASVSDALRLGCSAIGITIYPGGEKFFDMLEEAREIIKEAKSSGLAVVVWSYPRGETIQKENETALDIIAYAAYIAASIGANIVKVKPPTAKIANDKIPDIHLSSLSEMISYIKKSCFNGRRLVLFSGGQSKDDTSLIFEIKEIAKGGGDGSIVGRNSFQRPLEEAISITQKIANTFLHS